MKQMIDLKIEKQTLRVLKQELKTKQWSNISSDHLFELIEAINLIIDRINCHMEPDDTKLAAMRECNFDNE